MLNISIIIPCYNVEKRIKRTIYSVINQSYKNFQLILVNDGSTDNTLNILREFEIKDSRINVIDKKNGGVSSARNKGLKVATGEYIYFLDGDDTIDENLLENAIKTFNKIEGVDIFSFGFYIVDENKNILTNHNFKKYNNKKLTAEEFLNLYFTKKIRQCMCSFIVKKELIEKNEILFTENISYGEDQEFQIKLIANALGVYYDSRIYFHYLKHNDSVVNKEITLRRLDLLKSFINIKDYLLKMKLSKEVLSNLNIFIGMVFIFLLKEGKNKNGKENYFQALDDYSLLLKEVKIKFSKYGLITFVLTRLYLVNRKLLRKIL